MSKLIIAIDPGSSSGAMAIQDPITGIETINMPDSVSGILSCLSGYAIKKGAPDTVVVCEDVGSSMPGNAARSAATFAKHRGHLEMACAALGLQVTWVRPAKWMKELLGEYPKGFKNKSLRKTYIYEKMISCYPEVKFTKRQADALAILAWYQRKELKCTE